MGETHNSNIIALCKGRSGAGRPSAAQRKMMALSLVVCVCTYFRSPIFITSLSNWPLTTVEVEEQVRTATVCRWQVCSADPKPEIRRGFHNLSILWLPAAQATQAGDIVMLPKL